MLLNDLVNKLNDNESITFRKTEYGDIEFQIHGKASDGRQYAISRIVSRRAIECFHPDVLDDQINHTFESWSDAKHANSID